MVFNRFVEAGRVALVNSGKYQGKLVVLVDVLDQRRALVDGPLTGVPRQAIAYARLNLTDLKVAIPHTAGSGAVRRAYEKAEISTKWEATSWAKKLASRKKRATLNDMDRFKVKLAKQKRSRVLRAAVKKLKKEQK